MSIDWRASGAAAVMAAVVSAGYGGSASHSPLSFFAPAVVMEGGDRARLDGGRAVVKVLPGRGRELAIFAAVRVTAEPERLIEWAQRAETMQRGRYIPVSARFSAPPTLQDVDGLLLPDDDLEDIRRCRPGDCGLKLSAREMEDLRRGVNGDNWKASVQHGFREAIVARARAYLANGDSAAPPYEDASSAVKPDAEFASIIDGLGFLDRRMPWASKYLQFYPQLEDPHVVDSFLYWSTETLGIKPITSVTHVTVIRGLGFDEPAALVASKQVFANHYKDAALSIVAITSSSPADRYLVYVHRSHVDVLEGTLGGIVRRMVERRIGDEAPHVLAALKRTLEEGRQQ